MANIQGVEILSPIGKLVQGSVWELSDQTDDKGQPKKNDDGTPVKRAYFAIAVEKSNPEWGPFWAKLVQVGQSGYPQYFANGNMPGLKDFAYKVTDGDGIDKKGNPNANKPGFAGCWVIKFSSSFLPRCYEKGKYAKHEQLQDPRAIKPGYFVRVGAIVRPNIGSQSPGLYVNADLVSLEFVGEEIVFGRDASAAFAGAQGGYVPQGAQQLGAQTGMPAQQPQGMMPAQQPAPGGVPMGGMPMMPGQPLQPNPGFVQGAMQAAGVMPTPQAQPVYQPTPKAQGYTLDQFLAQGFNIDQLLNDGFFVRVG